MPNAIKMPIMMHRNDYFQNNKILMYLFEWLFALMLLSRIINDDVCANPITICQRYKCNAGYNIWQMF